MSALLEFVILLGFGVGPFVVGVLLAELSVRRKGGVS